MNIEKVIYEAFRSMNNEFTGFKFTNVLREFHLTEDQIKKHRDKFLKAHAKTKSYGSKTWIKNQATFNAEPKPFRVPINDELINYDDQIDNEQQELPQGGFCLFSRASCTLPNCSCKELNIKPKVDQKCTSIHFDSIKELPNCSDLYGNSELAFTISELKIIPKRDKGTDLAEMVIHTCIEVLKQEGFKILKPIQDWEEI